MKSLLLTGPVSTRYFKNRFLSWVRHLSFQSERVFEKLKEMLSRSIKAAAIYLL
jgi:hypothetical protein